MLAVFSVFLSLHEHLRKVLLPSWNQTWPHHLLCHPWSPPGKSTYGLSPPNSYVEALTLHVTVSGDKVFRRFSSVQSLSRVWLFATPWTAACQGSLSITNSQSLPKLMSIESVMPFNQLNLYNPLLLLPSIFPSIRVFSNSQLFASGGQSIGVSPSTSALLMNTQDWPPLGWTGWISLQSKGFSRVFSNTTVQKHQFFGAQLSL